MSAHRFLACGLLLALVGCTESKIPVSGSVKYNDEPLSDVNVVMVRDDGVVATAKTDASGSFANVTTESPADGALPGTYKVGITQVSELPDPETGALDYSIDTSKRFPPKYMNSDTSGLEVTVEEGMPPVELILTD